MKLQKKQEQENPEYGDGQKPWRLEEDWTQRGL